MNSTGTLVAVDIAKHFRPGLSEGSQVRYVSDPVNGLGIPFLLQSHLSA